MLSGPLPLPAGIETRLQEISEVDVLVGIPSFDNARTIGHVVRAAAAGLAKYFPDQRAVIVNSDGGSRDGTPEAVAAADFSNPGAILVQHPLTPVQKIVTPYHGMPGKGSAFRTIFAIAERLGAKACVVFDADLRSITPNGSSFSWARSCSGGSTSSPRCTCATSMTGRSPTPSSIR